MGFNIEGHSEMAQAGYDIVCAAVSSAAYMTANTITEILKASADVSVEKIGKMSVKVNYKNINLCKDILLGFKIHVIALEEQYPENITVNYTEV